MQYVTPRVESMNNHQSLATLVNRCGLTDYGSLIEHAASTTTIDTMIRYLGVSHHTAYGSSLGLTSRSHQIGIAIAADTTTCTINSSNSNKIFMTYTSIVNLTKKKKNQHCYRLRQIDCCRCKLSKVKVHDVNCDYMISSGAQVQKNHQSKTRHDHQVINGQNRLNHHQTESTKAENNFPLGGTTSSPLIRHFPFSAIN